MNHLKLEVRYILKPGCRDLFLEETAPVAECVRREAGCLRYKYTCPAEDDRLIILFETWETEEHQQVHLKQPHMAELKRVKAKYVTDTVVRKL